MIQSIYNSEEISRVALTTSPTKTPEPITEVEGTPISVGMRTFIFSKLWAILIVFFLLITVLPVTVKSQNITNYTFAATTGTFTALSSPTNPALSGGNVDDGYFNNIPIGFEFWYMGTRYTTVSASTNGWLTLGANITDAALTNNLTSGGSPRPVIAPLWDDLDIQVATNASYKTTGSAPNRVFTIQYLNTQWRYNATGNTISFQVKLYEGTGKIQFIYRPETGALATPTASIGITATATGSGNFLSVNNSGTSVSSTTEASVTSKPVSGKTYSFTPPVPTAPGSLTFTNIGSASMTLNWSDLSSNETGFVIYKSTDGVNYTFSSQTSAGSTSSVQSGLIESTTYYWKVYAVSEGGLSTALSGNQATTAALVLADWLYRKVITIDYTKVAAGPHTNFPVLISITDADLQTKAQTDADDILFISSDGTTKLNHEVESYVSASGTLVAWVQIPSLSSSANTVIYMYYGNASATSQQNMIGTWNTNFKGVYHLNGAFADATSNANNGTNTGTTNVTGKISNGSGFVRADGIDYITINGFLGSPTSFTLSAWATLTTADPNAAEIISMGDNAILRYDEAGANKTSGVAYNGAGVWTTTGSGINYAGTGWHYVVYTFDDAGNSQKVYVDGAQVATTSASASPLYTSGGTNTFIGKHGNGNVNFDFDGTIDEARVANASRSAGWVLTEYNNQNSPSTFYSVGSEVNFGAKRFTGTGNFSSAARWSDGTLPIAGNNLVIDGTCTVDNNAGTDNLTYGTLTIGTATGRTLNWVAGGTNRLNVTNVIAGAGASTLNMTNGGTLIIRGTWTSTNLTFTPGAGTIEIQSTLTLPAAYATYNNLTVNGSDINVGLATATAVNGTLTLSNGILVNGAWLTMATGSTISRSQGSIGTAPTFAGTVNITYTGSSPVTTGLEMPVSAGVLNNLTTNTGGVIQNSNPGVPTNILTEAFGTLTSWTGDIGALANQFSASATANAGGTANEGKYSYGSSTVTNTASIYRSVNTTGYTSVNISWKQFLDNYDPTTYPYTMKVQCAASSGGPWTDIYSISPSTAADIGPETKTYTNWTTNVGGTFYIRYYITGLTFGMDYWYFDDLVIETPVAVVASTVTVNGTMALASGTYSISSNSLVLNGGLSGSNAIVGSSTSNLSVGGSGSNLAIPSITTGLNNFTINRANGATLNGNITVNGVLYLQSANPSATQGSLHMGTNTLTMGASATTTGSGDVTGIIKRTSFNPNTPYSFGNEFTTITLSAGGTMPADISLKIGIGTAPSWKTTAVKHTYDIIRTGGSGTSVSLSLHYLDSELQSNTENSLILWDYHPSVPQVDEHGKSNQNTTENWVTASNINITYFSTAFDNIIWGLADKESGSFVWQGSVSTEWNNAANWIGGLVPGTAGDVEIPDASTTSNDPLLPSSPAASARSMTIQSGGVLEGGTATTLTVAGSGGAWLNSGMFNAGTSTVIFTNVAATMADTTNFYNVTIATGGGLTPGHDNTMRIAGAFNLQGSGVLSAALLSNTIEFNGTNQTVINPNGLTPGYYNLILSGSGTKTMPVTAMSIAGDFSMTGTASSTAGAALSMAGNVTISSGTTLNLSSYTHTVAGNLTNNGGTLTSSASSITLNGIVAQTLTSSAGIALTDLTITNANANVTLGTSTNCSIGGNLTIDAGVVFDLAANSLTSVTGSVSNSGTVMTQNTSTTPVPAGKTWGGDFEYTSNTAQTIVAGTYNNLTMSGTGGATAVANITVNGILGLASANPSSTKGILDMVNYTVLMGSSSTTIGPGDVTGIVRRTTITANATYTMGNQQTTIMFPNVGTLPSEVSLKISIGTAPSWKTGAIQRIYDLIQSGGNGTQALIHSHYLDSELNGNAENLLVDWLYIFAASMKIEYGRSDYNMDDNWVAISNSNIAFFSSVFGAKEVTMDESELTALTWNGSTSTSWVTATNWTPTGSPSDHTAITIPDAGTTAFDLSLPSIATCGKITLESGAILNSNSGAQLTINDGAGAWNNQGGAFNPGTSTLVFKNANATMAGSSDFYNLTIYSGANLTLENNSYTGIAGTFINNGTMVTTDQGLTTVEYKGGDQTVVVPNPATDRYSSLVLSGSGTKTMPAAALSINVDFSMSGTATATAGAAIVFGGNVTIGNGSTFITGNYNHSIAGNFENNGTFTTAAGYSISMNGDTVQSMGGTTTTTFDNFSIDNITEVTLSNIVNVNNVLELTSGNLSVGATTLGINGTISKASGYIEVIPTTSLSFGGTGAITLANNLFTGPPSIDDLTINRTGGVTLGNQNLTVNGLLDLPSGTFDLGANSLTIAGSSPTRTNGNIDASNAGATINFTNTAAITLPASIFTGDVNNLSIYTTAGITASSDFTLNGILDLQTDNPSTTKGSLDMWDGSAMKTLTMGANATTIGVGDVTGIVKRVSFATYTTYTFGNQFTSLSFNPGGTYPSQIQVKISIGSAPAWKTDGVKRTYDVIQTGESGSFVSMKLFYLDAELNGNTESLLVHWDAQLPAPPGEIMEHGKFNYDLTNNWVGCSNMETSYFPTSFGSEAWTLGNTAISNFTWNGSVSTDWTIAANWTPTGNPSYLNMAVIPDASTTANDPVIPALAEIKSLTIEAAGILNSGSGAELTIFGRSGAWIDFGTFNCSTGNVIFADSLATISGTTNFFDVTINSGASLRVTSGNTMRIAGTMNNNGVWHAVIGDLTTVEYNGGNQTVVVPNPASNRYSNLILSGSGTKTMPGTALAIYGDFSISGTATAIANGALTVDGGLSIDNGSNLSISPTANLTVAGTIANNAGVEGFILKSDTTGTASLIHHTDNVPATIQRYINGAAEAWHFLSSPVAAQGISGSWLPSGSYGNGTGYDLYAWDEPSNCWIYKLNTTSVINWNTVHPESDFTPGRGYLYSVQATNPTKEFIGNLNNASINYGLTSGSSDVNLMGFNFIGNPYPSSIDWQAASGWTRFDLEPSGGGYDMWIWNPTANNYGVFNSFTGSGTNSVTRFIAPMQGFFVQTASAGTLIMDNAVRVHDSSTDWKNAEINPSMLSLIIQSEADNSFDEVRLLFGYGANESGATKLFSQVVTAPSLYLPSVNAYYSVRYLKDITDHPTVPVMFKPGKAGNYTLKCNFDVSQFPIVLLEDRQTRKIRDLKQEPTYQFTASKIDDNNRFVLHFRPVNNQSEHELPGKILTDGTHIVIDLVSVSKETEVIVYDVLGRKVFQQKMQGGIQHTLNFIAGKQLLIVCLKNQDGSLNRKILGRR